MKLQQKTALIFIALLIVLLTLVSIFSSIVILSSYADLEQQYTAKNLEQALTRIDDEASTLSTIVSDWGPWDDSYHFVQGTKPDFIRANLAPDTFNNLRVNVIIITNREGDVVYSGAYDLSSRASVPVPEDLVDQLGPKNPLMDLSDPRRSTHGLLLLADNPMIIASRPIVRTDFSGEPQGVVIMGRYLDSGEVQRLAQLTSPSLNFFRLDYPGLPPDLVHNLANTNRNDGWVIQPLDRDTIAGYVLLEDIYGSDALILRINDSRTIYQQGAMTTLRFIWIILIAGLLFGIIVMFLLDRLVLSRLGTLVMQVHGIGSKTNESDRVEIRGEDEFTGLANEINLMLDTIEKTQKKIHVSEARFRELAEQLPLIIFEMDTNGNLNYVNKAGSEQFRITEQMIGQGVNIRILLSPDNIEQMQRGLAVVMSGLPSLGQTYSLQRSDGSFIKAIVSTSLIKKEGIITGFRGIAVDVTEPTRLREELEESTKLLTGILQATPVGVFRMDACGNINFVNETFTKITGIPFEKFRGTFWANILPEEERKRVLNDTGELIREQKATSAETRYIHPDGTPYWLFVQTVPLISKEGNLIGWVGTLTDITEQKFIAEALKDSEKYLQSLVSSIRAGIIVIDAGNHRIIDANPAALEMIGTTKDAIINQVCHQVICPAEAGRCPITDLDQEVDNAERTLRKPDGREISIIKSVVPVMLHGKQCLLETFIDNSYRKQIEVKLAESEEKYRALTENTVDILFSTDMAGIITFVSPQVNKYGFLVEEVIGQSLRILIHPGDIRRVESSLSHELETGAQFVSQFRIVDKWGTIYWFEEKSSLRLDISGKPVGIYGILRDVTERKRVEDAIDIANKKLNLMNQITRHDILNTITGLLGCVDMAKATTSPEEQDHLLTDIKDLTRVIQRHITFTREYQEVGVHLPQWQNIDVILNNVLPNFKKSGIAFSVEFERIEIFADPLLEKVFYNLVENAIRYGLTLTTVSIYPQISDKGLSLVFEDNGVGIDAGQKLEIFKRGVGKNTGMGLFLTAEILAITGITIEENGIFGKGARFEIRIPNGTWRFPRD